MMHIAHLHPFGPEHLVADIASEQPATIAVFQRHHIEFCCGGKIPLREACSRLGLDEIAVLDQLRRAVQPVDEHRDWHRASLTSLVAHVATRQHEPLRAELPRLHAMLQRVVSRHGERHGERLVRLLNVFETLQHELLLHVQHAQDGLFAVLAARDTGDLRPNAGGTSLTHTLLLLEAEHASVATLLSEIVDLTDGFSPPAWACPTFRGLYHGLGQLQLDLLAHMTLEHEVLFPKVRAAVA